MDELNLRLLLLGNIVIPLLFFMAWIYLGLHILFARFIAQPDSPVLWFFSVVTGPLTRPIRALLPAGSPETRVRTIALAVYLMLWIAVRVLFVQIGAGRG
jgi:hypothetical protein